MTTPKITRTAIKAYSIMDWPRLFIVLLSLNKVYPRKAGRASGLDFIYEIAYFSVNVILSVDLLYAQEDFVYDGHEKCDFLCL